jgi:hypothetical protein
MLTSATELVVNLHMHTTFSDGSGTHRDIADAALRCGIDVVIVTDHNIFVTDVEGIYKKDNKSVLMLVGEEVHNQARSPQKSHLLVFGTGREMSTFAEDPQRLVDAVRQVGGYSFIAHPFEYAAPSIGETAIDWEDWNVQGYNGLEIWNGFGEIKSMIPSKLHALFYAFFPNFIARAPYTQTLKKWDDLLAEGQRIYAVGGSDAHALRLSLGPLHRIVFPYDFHFSAINTHIIIPAPLSREITHDRALVLEALANGHSFIGYDLPARTRGFRFTAQGRDKSVMMGDDIFSDGGITLQIKLPETAECRLLKNGHIIKTWIRHEVCTHITTDPGIYRVEVYREYLGRKRGWIFSNPIFIR